LLGKSSSSWLKKFVRASEKFFGHAKKILFPINGELNLLSPGSGCPLQAGTGHGARTGSGPMLMRGDIFAASRGGGAGY
jgi:hypothetical protein